MKNKILERYLSLLIESDNISIYSYDEYMNIYHKLDDVVDFHNKYLPKNPHTLFFKRNKYDKHNTVVYIAVSTENEVVGLLESWINEDDLRVLITLIADEKYRQSSLSEKMFKAFLMDVKSRGEERVVVHFRDSNKDNYINGYSKFGFTDLQEIGKYSNDEIMWRMSVTF
jgi:ribosomal protein S18 acetylase RimI-like enzyme